MFEKEMHYTVMVIIQCFFATGNVVTFIYNCWKVFLESVFDFYLQLLESVNPNP